jgi:D-amino peptidase
MKIFISADIEGVAGVVHSQQGQPGNPEYEAARRLMTAEVNAAIEGAFAGGATEVLVNDSHGPMRNVLPAEIDPRARLISGRLKPLFMMQGVETGCAGAILLGYHARAGAERGILAHTYNGFAFARTAVNGQEIGEAGLNGTLAGTFGVPIIMITGDDVLQAEVAPLFSQARFVQTKRAISANCADSLAPAASRDLIRIAAEEAVRAAGGMAPVILDPPLVCEVRLNTTALADLMSNLLDIERLDGHMVRFSREAVLDVIRTLNVMSAMSWALR